MRDKGIKIRDTLKQHILNNKKAHIEDLFNEIKIIKKLKVNI